MDKNSHENVAAADEAPGTKEAKLHRLCPACERDNASENGLSYSRDDWHIKSCSSCGFVYLENPVSYEALRDDFAWEKTYEAESERRLRERTKTRNALSGFFKSVKYKFRPGHHVKIRSFIDRFVGQGRLLDVGCGQGGTIDSLATSYTPFGIEISPVLAARAEEKVAPRGGRIVVCDAVNGMSEFEDDYFQAVVMRAFLEHELEPARLLKEAYRVLEKGGVTIIKVPNFGCVNRRVMGNTWCGFRFPDHVNYFTPLSLRKMVTEAGFEIRSHQRWPLNDNMWLVAVKNT